MTTTDPFAGERLNLSHFHERQQALNIRDAWSAWNGYKFADCYYDAEYEYFCIRNQCGTYDICPMQKYGFQAGGRSLHAHLRQPLYGMAAQGHVWLQ
jgi:aminomethyltransferase